MHLINNYILTVNQYMDIDINTLIKNEIIHDYDY